MDVQCVILLYFLDSFLPNCAEVTRKRPCASNQFLAAEVVLSQLLGLAITPKYILFIDGFGFISQD